MVSFLHILLFLSLPLFVLILFMKYKNTIKNTSKSPPGPKGLPIIGNLHQLDNSNLHTQLWKLSKIYGPLFSLQIGFKKAIVVSSPKVAQQVLKDHDLDVCSRHVSLGQKTVSYNGLDILFAPYSDYWREIRKFGVINFFSAKKISSFSHVRKSEVQKMIKKISGQVRSSQVSNLSEISMSVVSSIVCRITFGRSYEVEGAEKSKFLGILNDMQANLYYFFLSDYIPFLGWIDKLNGSLAYLDNTFKKLDGFFEGAIKEHRDFYNKEKETKEESIIDMLLELKNESRFSINFTDDHIKAVLLDLLVGATDTSAASSVWMMTGLMKNPRVMRKAQEEIRNLCGKKEFIDEDDIEKLVYFKAMIKETLRLYAPAPIIPRETIKGFTLNGYEIEPNTLVYVNSWAIQRDTETWKDPEEFYPERFLNNDVDFKGQHFELLPFGAGRRVCPAIPLGIATVELITANLLNSFDWEMPTGMVHEDINTDGTPGQTTHKKDHLCLVAKYPM